jgi:hypothetical protein
LRLYVLRALELYPATLAGIGAEPRLLAALDMATWIMLETAGRLAWQALRENGDYSSATHA